MNAADFKAAIPEPYQILGLKLLPLSIGRYRLLQRFGCAFVSETDATATPADLILGVIICSMRCDEFLTNFEKHSFSKEINRWASRIGATPPFYLRGIGRVLNRTAIGRNWREKHSFNVVEKMKMFQRYIEEAQKAPSFHVIHTGGRSSAHWSTNVEIVLRSELNWTLEEISEAPLTKALSDYFKHLENQGLVSIITEEDVEIGKANAEALERISNGP